MSKSREPVVLREQAPPPFLSPVKQETSLKAEIKPVKAIPNTTPSIKVEEGKPSLRPAVLPNKTLANLRTEAVPPLPEVTAKPPPAPPAVPLVEAAVVKPVSEVCPSAGSHTSHRHSSRGKSAFAFEPGAARAKKKRQTVALVFFYVSMLVVGGVRYWFESISLSHETRLEGQVIPPTGMPLNNEVWLVIDFRKLTDGIAEDLAAERAPIMQDIQERQEHVQRAQADIATREERMRLLQQQIDSAKTDLNNIGTQARTDAQQIWDGPGAQLDDEYNSRVLGIKKAIADRAKSLNLKYEPDDSYNSPEVWANAYRLALYDVPATIDGAKEHKWLADLMKDWRAFLKTLDDRKEQLREQAAQIKIAPAAKITELNAKIDELQHRIDTTRADEDPIKVELLQAQADLTQAEAAETGLDDKYFQQLYALPGENVLKHIPLAPNGRFSWVEDTPFVEGESEHRYWIFMRATRPDGRQYWSLAPFSISRDQRLGLTISPESFISTKALLRPNLSPDEQNQ